MPNQTRRSKIITQILRTIKDKGLIDKKRLLAEIQFSEGFTRRTAEEYIQVLLDVGAVIEENGVIKSLETNSENLD